MNTRIPDLLRSTAMIACLTALATPGPGQDLDPGRPFVFEGGSLEKLTAALVKDASGRGLPANVVLPPEAREVTVPRVELQGASLQCALQAVAEIVASDWDVSVRTFASGPPGTQPVLSLVIRPSKRAARPDAPAALVTRVLSINNLTRTVADEAPDLAPTPATVLTAIEAGLGTIEGPAAAIRYHEDSRLVFVRGTATQVDLAELIVDRLESDTFRLRERALEAKGHRAPEPAGASGTSTDPAKDPPGATAPKRTSAERR